MPMRPARVGRVGVIGAPGREDRGGRRSRHTRPVAGREDRRGGRRRHTGTRNRQTADLGIDRADRTGRSRYGAQFEDAHRHAGTNRVEDWLEEGRSGMRPIGQPKQALTRDNVVVMAASGPSRTLFEPRIAVPPRTRPSLARARVHRPVHRLANKRRFGSLKTNLMSVIAGYERTDARGVLCRLRCSSPHPGQSP